jgi:two-component system cell cycle response regulator DivK
MKKILMVEDMLDNAELTRKMLVSAGYEVIHAPDAETGLDMALNQSPDLILLDLGLPDYDGQTLAGWLRTRPETAQIPIVVFTAWPEETARKMAESYGCNGYIAKPVVKVNDFIARIAAFIKNA